jgi:hypothetical protein
VLSDIACYSGLVLSWQTGSWLAAEIVVSVLMCILPCGAWVLHCTWPSQLLEFIDGLEFVSCGHCSSCKCVRAVLFLCSCADCLQLIDAPF